MLEVEKLSKSFYSGFLIRRRFDAVKEVSFSLGKGKVLGIVGESGSGKSTIAKLVVRLLKPTSGRIYFNGMEITSPSEKEFRSLRPKIQIIFQHPETALNPRMKIYDSIAEPLRIHRLVGSRREEEARVKELIREVNLSTELLSRYPAMCSGGEVQRVAIARILALEPELVVADEPTSMLDVSVQAQILSLMKRLQRDRKISYLFISHDMGVVKAFSDEVLVLKGGEMVEYGKCEKIFMNPSHKYTKKLIRASEFKC
ncbi:ABC transporter ATP-binding protein [Candidatus Pyrohabitans sp.]